VITTLAIICMRFPKSWVIFGVLIYGGNLAEEKLCCEFISALMAMIGALAGYFF